MKIFTIVIILSMLILPVNAQQFAAPEAPESAQKYMPNQINTFWEDLWCVIQSAFTEIQPHLTQAAGICLTVLVVCILVGVLHTFSTDTKKITSIAGTIFIGILLISPAKTLIGLGAQTVTQIDEYGKLLIPVLSAALAAQGGVSSSAALCALATLFCSILTALISKLLVPMIYIFLCLSVANCTTEQDFLSNFKNTVKGFSVWSLKTILYVFTGFLTITGVVSGAVDASALKAAKLTVTGFVPVVGGILSDASEAVLVGAGMMKNSAGIYGLLAITAIWIGPFLQIGVQYLLVKLTTAICNLFAPKETSALLQDFSTAMGIVLAMTGTECVIQLISIVCFMKGVG